MKYPKVLQASALLMLLLSTHPTHADAWTGKDKSLHFGVSAALGIAAYTQTHDRTQAFAWAIAPGIVKEIVDSQSAGNQFSSKDLAWDALGAFVGAQAGHWVIGNQQIAWVKAF
jgi:putative lipoprotein